MSTYWYNPDRDAYEEVEVLKSDEKSTTVLRFNGQEVTCPTNELLTTGGRPMQHIKLMCKNHPHLRWSAKSIAVNSDGSYNGSRNLFFQGQVIPEGMHPDAEWSVTECSCSPKDLTFASAEEKAKWETDHAEGK